MPNDDTVKLLKECDAGTKMAVASINEVLSHVKSNELNNLLEESLKEHEEIGNQCHQMLLNYKDEDKEPNPVAKAMSWLKTNTKLIMNETDKEVADLLTDGCGMGIKSVCRYMNQYPTANEEVKALTERLVKIEEDLMKQLRKFL